MTEERGANGEWGPVRHGLVQQQSQSDGGTSVLSPGPSLRQKHPKGSTRDSWNNSRDRYDYRDKWTDVWKK